MLHVCFQTLTNQRLTPSLLLLDSQNVLIPNILQLRSISTKRKDTNSESLISSSEEGTFRGNDSKNDGHSKNPFDDWRKRFLQLAGSFGVIGFGWLIIDPIKIIYQEFLKRKIVPVLFNETKSKQNEVVSTDSLSLNLLNFKVPKGKVLRIKKTERNFVKIWQEIVNLEILPPICLKWRAAYCWEKSSSILKKFTGFSVSKTVIFEQEENFLQLPAGCSQLNLDKFFLSETPLRNIIRLCREN